jgi:hypothetical protein
MLPDPTRLPADIAELGRLQFLRVRETHLEAELDHLAAALGGMLPDLAVAPERGGAVRPEQPGAPKMGERSAATDATAAVQQDADDGAAPDLPGRDGR